MITEKTKEILERALKKAGNILLTYYGKQVKARVKESISSVVTIADLAAEKEILEILKNPPGLYNIITEESGYMGHGSEYTWVVDPLDGTSNFAAGLPWFGVIIALFHKDTPILGGMYLPVSEDLYLAEQGKGAWKNGEALKASTSVSMEENLVAYSFDFNDTPGKTESEMDVLAKLSKRVRNIRSTNSLVDFCYVADGRLGAALNQSTKIWDIAVPWLLIREAGGAVSDIHGKEIRFDISASAVDQNYTIAASGKGLHRDIIKAIELK
jgi:myo-inositol-1(or 4)-monophosphatase